MALMAVPETGLELYHSQIDPQSSKNASQYAQVMQLDLDDAVFRDIIKTCRHGGGKTLHISFGKSIVSISINGKFTANNHSNLTQY